MYFRLGKLFASLGKAKESLEAFILIFKQFLGIRKK